SLTKKALDYIYHFFEQKGGDFLFHDFEHVQMMLEVFKTIAKNERLKKYDIEIAKLVVAFKDVGIVDKGKPELDNQLIIDNFLSSVDLTSEQLEEFIYLM